MGHVTHGGGVSHFEKLEEIPETLSTQVVLEEEIEVRQLLPSQVDHV